MIKFFESMCKMLPAVVARRKGDICNVQSTVAQKEGSLFHTLAVDVGVDSAAVFFCEECLEIGFIDPCIGGNGRNADIFQIVLVNVAERFFQISTSGCVLAGTGAEGKLCKHPAEKKKEEKFFLFYLAGTPLQEGEKIFEAIS